MKYSLINVTERNGDRVNGYWIQDFIGSRVQAEKRAKRTEEANGNRIEVAIVESVSTTTPLLNGYMENLKAI